MVTLAASHSADRSRRSGAVALALAALTILPGSGTAQQARATAKEPPASGRAEPAPPLPAKSPQLRRRAWLSAVASWRYQLRRIDPAEIKRSSADLVVMDYAPDRVYGIELPFERAEVEAMKVKPDGGRRLLLAYLSIGEAERYRTYWNNAWYDPPTRPEWLLDANKNWDGNFIVRFWQPAWQRIVFGTPDAYLDRIVAAGFDGVYLDRADVFQELVKEQGNAEALMAGFVTSLAAHARRLDPGFIVVMQNAEELTRRADVAGVLDGLAKEDLYFGVAHDEAPNESAMVTETVSDLRRARTLGLKVLVVEYLSLAHTATAAMERARREGFLPLIAERSLGTLEFEPAPAADPAAPATLPASPGR